MAKCAVCGKGVHFGNAVSHSHRRSNKIWKSNLKSVRVKVNGGTKKMYVCTSCLRSGKVERAQSEIKFHIFIVRLRYSHFVAMPFFFVSGRVLLTGKEVIAKHETGNNNAQGEKSMMNKEHDAHADSDPEKNKAQEAFHVLHLPDYRDSSLYAPEVNLIAFFYIIV